MRTSQRKRAPAPTARAGAAVSGEGRRRAVPAWLQGCFFLSGAAALVDQVAWTKLLGQLFGYSAYAVATVLAVFMGGLAAGSALFARWRPKAIPDGIALYALLEGLIALSALASLPGFPLLGRIYLALYPHGGGFALLVLRFFGSALLLAVPTVLMGGTFPVLLGAVARGAEEAGARASRLYSVNTAGAVFGTLAAGFLLVPGLGLRLTIVVAAAGNLLAGIAAWRMAGSRAAAGDRPGTPAAPVRDFRLYLACFACVGAAAMACELGWTRLLATFLLSSTYAFSLMLAAFLLGIALGSAAFEVWFRRRTISAGTFAATQLATAAAVVLSLLFYHEIPGLLLALLRAFGRTFPGLLAAEAVVAVLAVLPVALCCGFNYPAVLALVSRSAGGSGDPTPSVGRAIAANTAGAISGALVAGFVLLPRTGSFRLLAIAGAANAALAVLLSLRSNRRAWRPLGIAAVLLAALAAAGSEALYREASAAFSVVLYGANHSPRLTAREMAESEDVVFFRDGIQATIAVTRSENYVALKTNGKVDASNLDSGTQLLLGDLGAVFHANPRRVLIVGFGGGMTASAVARFPEVERIDCVEIEPAVLEAAGRLERLHRGVLSDPRLHVYLDDARNFLAASRERYDLIVSEPSNPWIAGIASLYTREFFETARRHLSPGGSFVQWVQAYGLGVSDLAMILRSLEGFRDLTLWRGPGRDYLVLARETAAPLGYARSRALWSNPLLREDFGALHLSRPEGWSAYFRMNDAAIRAFAVQGALNTDDRTRLESSAPRHLLDESLAGELERSLEASDPQPLPDLPAGEAARALAAAAETALEVNPRRAERFLALIPESSESGIEVLRARNDLAHNRFERAVRRLKRLRAVPNHYDSEYWLARALQAAGQRGEAEAALDALLTREPNHAAGLEAKVDLAAARQDWSAAISSQERIVAQSPGASNWCRLGDLYLRGRNLGAAAAPLKNGLAADPYAFLCHRDLGELYRASHRDELAIAELVWVVRYFPEADPKTYASLALAYASQKDQRRAEEALEKGRRIFPEDPLLRGLKLAN